MDPTDNTAEEMATAVPEGAINLLRQKPELAEGFNGQHPNL